MRLNSDFFPSDGIPTTREVIRLIWDGGTPDYSCVTDAPTADLVLTGLVSAALDVLAYRQIETKSDSIQLVSGDRLSYLKYAAAMEATADRAVLLSHMLAANAYEAVILGELTSGKPPFRCVRILILAHEHGCVVNRVDLDPKSQGGVSWYGPFDRESFDEIAVGFALFVTHVVANVFDDDDGEETFKESVEWIA